MANLDFINALMSTVAPKKQPPILPPGYDPSGAPPRLDVPQEPNTNTAAPAWASNVLPPTTDTPAAPIAPLPPLTGNGSQDFPQDLGLKGMATSAAIPPAVPVSVAAPVADSTDPAYMAPASLLAAQKNLTDIQNAPWKTNNKGFKVGPDGTIITDNKDHYSGWDKVAHFLEGWAKGGLAGGIGAARDPHYTERASRQQAIADAAQQLGTQQEITKFNTGIANTVEDNRTAAQKEADLKTYRDQQIAEAAQKRQAVDRHVKMRTAMGMWKAIPSYNPDDPKFKQLTDYLKSEDVNLPLTPKDAKKNVKQVQDAETGAWTLVLTDPTNGEQEVRPITTKDGKQLVTTSPTKVSAEAAGQRQEAGFTHSEKMLQLQDSYKRGFADYQKTLDDAKAARDEQTKADLMTKANQQRIALMGLRTQLHQIEQEQ